MTTEELQLSNQQLRKEVEQTVLLFEQYLRVAMLQTESEHFQKKLAEERMKNASVRMITNVTETSTT